MGDSRDGPMEGMIEVHCTTESEVLSSARECVPDRTLRLQALQPATNGGDETGIRLLFWISDGDFADFERAVEADPTVTGLRLLTETEQDRLYRVIYTDRGMRRTICPAWIRQDGIIRSAWCRGDRCNLRLLLPNRQALVGLKRWFDERDLPFELREVLTLTGFDENLVPGLSPPQSEALRAAMAMGHFEVPRKATTEEVASHLGISDTALSQRLRRAHSTVYDYLLERPEQAPIPKAKLIG